MNKKIKLTVSLIFLLICFCIINKPAYAKYIYSNKIVKIYTYINNEKEGIYAKLYDTTGDGKGETLVINNISNFTYKGNLITDFDNADVNQYQESKWHDEEIGAYQTPWNGMMESDLTRQQYKEITNVIIIGKIKPKNMSMWFYGFPLNSIQGLDKIDTSECTNMYGLFQLSSNSKITTLNLSTWDTSKVKNMLFMFKGASKIKTIYASNKFVVSKTTITANMFNNCISLVGGKGTKYDSSKTNGTYARIDLVGKPRVLYGYSYS